MEPGRTSVPVADLVRARTVRTRPVSRRAGGCSTVEYDDSADELLQASVANAESAVEALVQRLAREMATQREGA